MFKYIYVRLIWPHGLFSKIQFQNYNFSRIYRQLKFKQECVITKKSYLLFIMFTLKFSLKTCFKLKFTID